MFLIICSRKLYRPVTGLLESLSITFECERLLAQFPAPCIDCPDIMCLTADVTSNDQHVIADEGEFLILAEFPLSFEISPGKGSHFTEYTVRFFYHLPLFLYIHHRINLIVCSFCFTIHFRYLLCF